MKVAIIGSRNFKDEERAKFIIINLLNGYLIEKVITGGAPGPDTWAIEICKHKKVPCEVIRPIDSEKISYLYRNIEIITKADKVLAFWDGESRGTKFVIDYCKARKIPLEIIL